MRAILVSFIAIALCISAYKLYNPTIVATKPKPWISNVVTKPPTIDPVQSITKKELKEFLEHIASADMAGRAPGTEGFRKSAEFVEKEFKSYGMKGANKGSFKQHFTDNRGSKTWNVAGFFPGNDPKLKDEVIVIGAHLDHLGRSSRGIYYGADDNGSGSVALLEIAEAVSLVKHKIKRTVMFISFSSEERGLIGSGYYIRNPLFPISKTVAMINMDMIGHLKNQSSLGCIGAGGSSALSAVLRDLDDDYPFSARITKSYGGGSDHVHFARRRMPICFFHTGTGTGVYHTPRDTVDRIDFDGMTHVVKFVFEFYYKIDSLNTL